MSKKAIIVVDVLNDFVTGEISSPTAGKIIAPLQNLLKTARAKSLPIIYTCDAHRPGVDGEFKVWAGHALAGTAGAEVIPELAPQPEDHIVPKRRYSGFFQTDLDLLLRELKIESLIITGVYLTLCVQHTVGDAYNFGYGIEVPSDCVASFSDDDFESGLKYLKDAYGAEVVTSNEIINRL
ncbi:nicotinamidase [Deltaproteobacteria bacterium Smac51]|nr:nicotinamidase [Deltaproteobacteria bacterium Smac51]